MNKKELIKNLEYRIQRYQAMGNGAMCQTLSNELLRVTNSNSAAR